MAHDADTKRIIRRVANTALVASTIEWYDFFIYGTAAALAFPKIFFAATLPPAVALLIAFATFAVGFVIRPIGAVVFGQYGDRVGRKKALVTALIMMAGATTLMGLLPSYASAGVLAPIALILLRCVQGFALGGQMGGATLLIAETAPRRNRGFYGSFGQAGAGTGTILANLVFLWMSVALDQKDFISWGWRVPFLLSLILIPVALYIQLRIEDTPAFKKLEEMRDEIHAGQVTRAAPADSAATDAQPSSALTRAVRGYPRQLVLAAGSIVGNQVAFYIMNVFAVAYATNALALSRNTMLTGVLFGALAFVVGIYAGGASSDRFGRRKVIMAGGALIALWAFPFFSLIETRSTTMILLAICTGMLFIGITNGPQASFLAELFKTDVRYTGVSLAYQGGAIFGGGIAPLIATALYSHFATTSAVSAYVAICCVVTVISAGLSEESAGRDLT